MPKTIYKCQWNRIGYKNLRQFHHWWFLNSPIVSPTKNATELRTEMKLSVVMNMKDASNFLQLLNNEIATDNQMETRIHNAFNESMDNVVRIATDELMRRQAFQGTVNIMGADPKRKEADLVRFSVNLRRAIKRMKGLGLELLLIALCENY